MSAISTLQDAGLQELQPDMSIFSQTPQQKAAYYNGLLGQGYSDADVRAAFGGIPEDSADWNYLRQLAGASKPAAPVTPVVTPAPVADTVTTLQDAGLQDTASVSTPAGATPATNPWAIDYNQFKTATDPYLNGGNYWANQDGPATDKRPELTLANGKTWTPSGWQSGITYHPKGEVTYETSFDGNGGEGGNQVSTPKTNEEDYWEVRGDMSGMLGQPGSEKHVGVKYKKEGDQLVPMEDPLFRDYQTPYGTQNRAFLLFLAAAAGGAGLLEAGAGASAAGTATTGTGLTGAADLAAAGSASGAYTPSLLSTISNLPSTIGTAITPAGTPGWLANAAGSGAMSTGTSLAQGNDLGTALETGLTGAVTGAAYTGLNTLAGDVLNPLLAGTGIKPQDAINIGKAIVTGDTSALINAGIGAGIYGLSKLTDLTAADLPGWLTKANVSGAVNLTNGLASGNITQILSGASALTGSTDTNTAARASALIDAANSGNWTRIAAAAGGLDKALGGSGSPTVKAPAASDATSTAIASADPTTDYQWYENDSTIGDRGGSADDMVSTLQGAGLVNADADTAVTGEVAATAGAGGTGGVSATWASTIADTGQAAGWTAEQIAAGAQAAADTARDGGTWDEAVAAANAAAVSIFSQSTAPAPTLSPATVTGNEADWYAPTLSPATVTGNEADWYTPAPTTPTVTIAPKGVIAQVLDGTDIVETPWTPPWEEATPEPTTPPWTPPWEGATPEPTTPPWAPPGEGATPEPTTPPWAPPGEGATPEPTYPLPTVWVTPAPTTPKPTYPLPTVWVTPAPTTPPPTTPPRTTPAVTVKPLTTTKPPVTTTKPPVTTKKPTATVAPRQVLQDTQTALPTELADIHQMNLDDWTLEDLVKYLEESRTGKKQKAKQTRNPIYAAEGGSIDDLIEYLRS